MVLCIRTIVEVSVPRELKVKIADFKRSARRLSAKGMAVTVSNLALELGKTSEYVEHVFESMAWLRSELNVQSAADALYAEMRRAILALMEAGVTPSFSSVARKLGIKERKVRSFVDRHYELLIECGMFSLSEDYAYRKAEYFKERILELSKRGVEITPTTYATAYRVDRSSLYKVIHTNAEVAALFGLSALYRPAIATTPDPHSKT